MKMKSLTCLKLQIYVYHDALLLSCLEKPQKVSGVFIDVEIFQIYEQECTGNQIYDHKYVTDLCGYCSKPQNILFECSKVT